MQVSHGYESPVLGHLEAKAQKVKRKDVQVAPSTLTLFKPVLLPPDAETKVLVTIRATGQCLVAGRKEFLAKHRNYMALWYYQMVERPTPFFVFVVNVSQKPINLAKGTRVGSAEHYRGSAYTLSNEDLLNP